MNIIGKLVIAGIFIALVIGGGFIVLKKGGGGEGGLSDWEQCVRNSRSHILQTSPRQCVLPDGRRTIEPRVMTPPSRSPVDTPPAPVPEPQPAPPPPTSALRGIDALRTPTLKSIIDALYHGGQIAADGAVEANQKEFEAVAHQRGGTGVILRGIANRDTALIEKGVKALEYGFQFQEPAGNFKNNLGLSAKEAISSDAFFMAVVGDVALLIRDSEYASEFLPRFNALKPKIEKAVSWLAQTENQAELKRQDGQTPNRLIFDALAYSLNGTYLGRKDFERIGDDFVNTALAVQRSDGVIPEKGGHDSSYQAVSILNLATYWFWTGNSSMKLKIYNAMEKAAAWEKTRVNPTSGVISEEGNTRTGSGCKEVGPSGKCKDINYPEVSLAFAFWAAIGNDSESGVLATKILDYMRSSGRLQ